MARARNRCVHESGGGGGGGGQLIRAWVFLCGCRVGLDPHLYGGGRPESSPAACLPACWSCKVCWCWPHMTMTVLHAAPT